MLKFKIESLREVVSLTKDMLNIRELENKDLTSRFSSMDTKLEVERNRKNLMEQKIELSDKMYGDLKTEYLAQREIFKVSLLIYHRVGIFQIIDFFHFLLETQNTVPRTC